MNYVSEVYNKIVYINCIMLLSITIQNFVSISYLHLEFCKGLNVITGASGSGKSLILQALGLITGDKMQNKIIRLYPDKNISLTGKFNIENLQYSDIIFNEDDQLKEFSLTQKLNKTIVTILNSLDITETRLLTLRRVITLDNRSRFYINDIPCTSQQIKKISVILLQIINQNSSTLLSNEEQIQFLDAFTLELKQVNKLQIQFNKWQESQKKLNLLKEDKKRSSREIGYLRYLADEISQINPKSQEENDLTELRKKILSTKNTKTAINKVLLLLEDEQYGVLNQIYKAEKILSKEELFLQNSDLNPYIDLNSDIGDNIADTTLNKKQDNPQGHRSKNKQITILEDLEFLQSKLLEMIADLYNINKNHDSVSNSHLDEIETRLSLLKATLRKYEVKSSDELIDLLDNTKTTLNKIDQIDFLIESIEKEIDSSLNEYLHIAKLLSESRKYGANILSYIIKKELNDMEMSYVDFHISVQELEQSKWNIYGIDQIQFMMNSVSNNFDLVSKIASGGELSRILLAIYLAIAKKNQQKTLIFDEIDVGIGGSIASSIGNKLYSLAQNMQTISITHQPQVAVYSNCHILVCKENKMSQAKVLNDEEIEKEIGRMLSGRELHESSIVAAKFMIQNAKEEVSSL